MKLAKHGWGLITDQTETSLIESLNGALASHNRTITSVFYSITSKVNTGEDEFEICANIGTKIIDDPIPCRGQIIQAVIGISGEGESQQLKSADIICPDLLPSFDL